MSIRSRILLGYIVLVISSLSLMMYLVVKDVRPRYLEAVEESTVDIAQILGNLLSEQAAAQGNIELELLQNTLSRITQHRFKAQIFYLAKDRTDIRVYVTDAKGILLFDSAGLDLVGSDYSKWNDVLLTLNGSYGARSTRTNPADPTTSTIYVAAPILHNEHIIGVVSVGKPKDNVSFFIDIAKRKFILVAVLTGISAICLGILLSSWISNPVKKLSQHIQKIKSGEKSRLSHLGSSEIAVLGSALEEMREELEGKQYIEKYVQTLTHEIKSPITAIKGASELLTGRLPEEKKQLFLKNIGIEAERLQSLVERLLQLSALERKSHIESLKPFDFAELIQDLQKSFATQLHEKQIRLTLQGKPLPKRNGDPFLIRQAMANVLQNSISFSSPSSCIELTSAMDDDKNISITIRDFGPGIPEYAREKIFQRFYSLERPDTGKKSTGLGLPFVQEVMQLHSGEVHVVNAEPGVKVTLLFPPL